MRGHRSRTYLHLLQSAEHMDLSALTLEVSTWVSLLLRADDVESDVENIISSVETSSESSLRMPVIKMCEV